MALDKYDNVSDAVADLYRASYYLAKKSKDVGILFLLKSKKRLGEKLTLDINKIVKEDNKIIYSDNSLIELKLIGYPIFDIKNMFKPFKPILIFVESTKKEIGKAKDLSLKRNIPKRDALHALIARDNRTILVTLDEHYKN